jgi:hypothetical protein
MALLRRKIWFRAPSQSFAICFDAGSAITMVAAPIAVPDLRRTFLPEAAVHAAIDFSL